MTGAIVDPASFYGMPPPPASSTPTTAPAPADQPAAVGAVRKGLTQDPVLLLVGLLLLAFLLARAAEHGISLGFKLSAR